MKKTIINSKYTWLLATLISVTACNDIDDVLADNNIEPDTSIETLPELTPGTVDFSNYIALGASFTAGFTDGGLFIAAQENAFPNILSKYFTNAGGGAFSQPTMNDNFGGLALGGNRITDPRLVFGESGPTSLESIIGDVTVSTDIALNNPTGPFNNLGVPGAKSFHLLAPGFGNISNVPLQLANPYFVRMTGATPDISVLEMAMSQNPTFFTLSEIGGNDVLGYATTGGDDTDAITDTETFRFAFSTLVNSLTSDGAKGIVINVPYITDLPHFTTVTHNIIPLDADTATVVNGAYAQYNGGLQLAHTSGLIDDTELAKRTIVFEASETNAVVIEDEYLTNLSALGIPNYRQATANDLFVLGGAAFIGTEAVEGNPLTVNGVAIPLTDKWVLTPQEQENIKTATDAYNDIIGTITTDNTNIALVDFNSILTELASTGISFGNFQINANLITGGAVSLDGVHLTARGYSYMAYKFLEAIDINFGSNFIASGNVPDPEDFPTNYSPVLQ